MDEEQVPQSDTQKDEARTNDPVNHPKHYTTHPSGVECIEIARHMNFNLGNAIKYIWRVGEKGNTIEDLQKAAWYINDEIKRLEGTKKVDDQRQETGSAIRERGSESKSDS